MTFVPARTTDIDVCLRHVILRCFPTQWNVIYVDRWNIRLLLSGSLSVNYMKKERFIIFLYEQCPG